MFPLPDGSMVRVPLVTFCDFPVTASTYVPFGIPLKVAPPVTDTQTKLSMPASALV